MCTASSRWAAHGLRRSGAQRGPRPSDQDPDQRRDSRSRLARTKEDVVDALVRRRRNRVAVLADTAADAGVVATAEMCANIIGAIGGVGGDTRGRRRVAIAGASATFGATTGARVLLSAMLQHSKDDTGFSTLTVRYGSIGGTGEATTTRRKRHAR